MLVLQHEYLQVSVIQQILLDTRCVRINHSHVLVVEEGVLVPDAEVVVEDVVMEYSNLRLEKSVMLSEHLGVSHVRYR